VANAAAAMTAATMVLASAMRFMVSALSSELLSLGP
jgi:hypothetical protein